MIDRAAPVEWPLPVTLTAVLLPPGQVSTVVSGLPTHTLVLPPSMVDVETPDEVAVLLVPDATRIRTALRRQLASSRATIGPGRPWQQVAQSLHRAVLARNVLPDAASGTVDTDEWLVELLVRADSSLVAELRAQVLAPLDAVRPGTRARLEQTLRSWLLHQGRREDVAADLHLHPQTIRYRMDQVKELFGDRLRDPEQVLAITIALADPAIGRDSSQHRRRLSLTARCPPRGGSGSSENSRNPGSGEHPGATAPHQPHTQIRAEHSPVATPGGGWPSGRG